jgi:hypothetical protein
MRYVQIKRQAELRGLPFALTRSEVNAYWDQPCHYCGGAIPGVMLDRVDNTRGYEPGNVVSCCRRCNMWKLTLSEDAFTTHLTRIYQHYVLRQPQPPSVLAYRSARVQPTEAQRDLATSRRECAEALEDAYRFVDDAWGLVVMMGRVHTVVVRALERELAYEQARNRRWRTQADRPR